MVFFCKFCSFSSFTWKELLRHTFEAHSSLPGFRFTCGVHQCPQMFKTYSSILSHLRRKHRGANYELAHASRSIQNDTVADTPDCFPSEVEDNDENESIHPISGTSNLVHSAALFLLSLKEHHQVTQSALDFAIGQVQQMVTFAVEDVRNNVEARLQLHSEANSAGIPDLSDLFQVPDPFDGLQNEYMRTKFTKITLTWWYVIIA